MKLAYIVFLPQSITGVQKSIREKADALHHCSIDMDVFVLNAVTEEDVGWVKYVKIKSNLPGKLKYLDYIFRRFDVIENSIPLSRYDCIILRYPCSDASGVSFTKKYKIVTEHHSDVRNQFLATLSASTGFSEKILKRIRAFLEHRYGYRVLRNCAGIIAVTDEISNVEKQRAAPGARAIVVPNGIDVKSIKHTRYRKYDGEELHLAFVASSLNPWHGMERIETALAAYKGSSRITLHVVGDIAEGQVEIKSGVNAGAVFHGVKEGRALDDILANSNLAISTLGLFKNRMNEACTLKTREYTARGLPFVIGYRDPDLTQVDPAYKFALQVPNDETPVDIELMLAFAKEISKEDNPEKISTYMRNYAFNYMDWGPKMKAYEKFCIEL